jgi:hypothetical protein
MAATRDSQGKVTLRPEQILVAGRHLPDDDTLRRNASDVFWFGGEKTITIPWHLLGRAIVYATDTETVERLMVDACRQGYMILNGSRNERRGVTGYTVGIGAWGHRGKVEVKAASVWAMEPEEDEPGDVAAARIQKGLRDTCTRLNEEKCPFRATGVGYVASLYRRMHLEPTEDFAEPLPREVEAICRHAHVGGPILQVRSSLSPWVSIDRDRAFGTAMMEPLPCGKPTRVPLRKNGLERWNPRDLMARTGFAEATVQIEAGPAVSLLPLLRPHPILGKNMAIYPTGTLRGVWALSELAFLEQHGQGYVTAIHQAFTFDSRPVLRPIIQKLRKIEKELKSYGIQAKRLEHMLYGWCSRRNSMHRFASSHGGEGTTVSDLVAPHMLRRLGPDVTLSRMRFQGKIPGHPLYQVKGSLTGRPPPGTMDRPDRSAWITASNRIAIAKILQTLDPILSERRPGDYVGRIYVDGIDIQASPDQIPKLDGCSIRDHGTRMHIYRAGTVWAERADSSNWHDATGMSIPRNCTENDLRAILAHDTDPSGGPFAGGRVWLPSESGNDPRWEPDMVSSPLHLDEEMISALGFTMP